MKIIEEEGKTVEEAIQKVLDQLNTSRDTIEVEIVSKEKKGIFGIGAQPAKIKVTYQIPKEKDQIFEAERKNPQIEDEKILERFSESIEGTKEVLKEILGKMNFNSTIEVKNQNGEIVFNIRSEDERLLIGKKGKTIDALEYIVNRIVNKNLDDRLRITLDTSDYRIQRQRFLKNQALKLSRRVKHTGKSAVIAHLSPADRKTIHLALQDDPDVKTLSRGNGFFRKIIICANHNNRSK